MRNNRVAEYSKRNGKVSGEKETGTFRKKGEDEGCERNQW